MKTGKKGNKQSTNKKGANTNNNGGYRGSSAER